MKCIVTGKETDVMFRNFPMTREGRYKMYEVRDSIIDRLITAGGYEEMPRELAVQMIQLQMPVNTRVVLFCYKNGKDPYEVFKVTDEDLKEEVNNEL